MESEAQLNQINVSDFLKVELITGTIIKVEVNKLAKIAAYKLSIHFGSYGIKTSSAQITENYTADALIGKQIIAVVNFPPKKVAGVKSEVLVLAAVCETNGTILIAPYINVRDGTRIL
jgi:tRNA-binding protein